MVRESNSTRSQSRILKNDKSNGTNLKKNRNATYIDEAQVTSNDVSPIAKAKQALTELSPKSISTLISSTTLSSVSLENFYGKLADSIALRKFQLMCNIGDSQQLGTLKNAKKSDGDIVRGVNNKSNILFTVTFLSYALLYFCRKNFSVVKGTLENELGFRGSDLGNIDTSFLVLYAVGQFYSGIISKYFSIKSIVIFSYLGSSVSNMLFGACDENTPKWIFLALWAVNGYCQSNCFPVMMTILRMSFERKTLGTVLGFWTTCQQVGGILSTIVPGFIMVMYGWKYAFFIPSLIVASSSILLLISIPSTLKETEEVEDNTKIGKKGNATPHTFWQVVNLPGIWNLSLAYACIKWVRYAMMFWLPYYLERNQSYTASTAALTATLFDIGGTFGSVFCGYITDFVTNGRRMPVIFPMCLITGTLACCYSLLSSSTWLITAVLMFLLGLMVSGCDSVLGGISTADQCDRLGCNSATNMASGIVNGCGSVGAIMQGKLTLVITEKYGWNAFFASLSFLSFAAGIVLIPLVWQELNFNGKNKIDLEVKPLESQEDQASMKNSVEPPKKRGRKVSK